MNTASKKHLLNLALIFFIVVVAASACSFLDGASSQPTEVPTAVPEVPTAVPEAPTAMPTLPDFALVGYWRDPAEPQYVPKNTVVYFHIQVANLGEAPYERYILVQGPGNHSDGCVGLQPGETKEVVVPVEVYASGPGEVTASDIYFTVDPDNVITETTEDNNSLGPFTIVYYGSG